MENVVGWDFVVRKKAKGGSGIGNWRMKNVILLGKCVGI